MKTYQKLADLKVSPDAEFVAGIDLSVVRDVRVWKVGAQDKAPSEERTELASTRDTLSHPPACDP